MVWVNGDGVGGTEKWEPWIGYIIFDTDSVCVHFSVIGSYGFLGFLTLLSLDFYLGFLTNISRLLVCTIIEQRAQGSYFRRDVSRKRQSTMACFNCFPLGKQAGTATRALYTFNINECIDIGILIRLKY